MKKSLSLILAMLFVASTFLAFPVSAGAATLSEKESNDSISDAQLITLGDTLNGKTDESFDFDYYKFISNEDGKININFNSLETDKTTCGTWSLFLYGPNEEEIGMATVEVTDTSTVVLPFIGAKAGNYYYLLVYPGPRFASGHSYKIRTSFTKGKYYEKEVNNTEASAGKLILANDYVGTIGADFQDGDSNEVYDSDYYHIQAPAKGTMTVTFKHKKKTPQYTSGWNVVLYKHHNGGNLSLSESSILMDSAASKTLYKATVAKNAEFWLNIYSIYDGCRTNIPSDIVGEPYTISSTFVLAAKPKITVKTSKNSVTMTSKKLADITGYEIQIKSGKKFKKLKTTKGKALKYTKKGLKKSTKYTFRVRAYLKKDGTKYYGKWVTVTAKTKAK